MEQMDKLAWGDTDQSGAPPPDSRIQVEDEEEANVKVHALIFSFLILPLLLSGCWDRVEIQDRLIVMAVAIDKAAKKNGGRNYYEFTAQLTEARAMSRRISNPNVAPVFFGYRSIPIKLAAVVRHVVAEPENQPCDQ